MRQIPNAYLCNATRRHFQACDLAARQTHLKRGLWCPGQTSFESLCRTAFRSHLTLYGERSADRRKQYRSVRIRYVSPSGNLVASRIGIQKSSQESEFRKKPIKSIAWKIALVFTLIHQKVARLLIYLNRTYTRWRQARWRLSMTSCAARGFRGAV